jgi:WS/DGAT/MGAT family acyltransferase
VDRATNPAEVVRGMRDVVTAPSRAADAIVRELGAAGSFLRTGFGAPPSPINCSIGPYRRFGWVRTNLDELKHVKNLAGGTVNDAVIAAVAGGLGRFLRGRGQSTDGLELRAMVPVSVRAADEHGALGNRVSAMMAPLPVGRRDPIDRLRAVSQTMRHLKESGQAVGASLLTDVTNFTPPTIAAQAARLQSRQRFFNTVVTNVPGPQFPLYLLGRELLDIVPMVPLAGNQAVCFGIMSYNGGVNFGLVGDYDSMPDLDALLEDLGESVSELVEAAGSAERGGVSTAGAAKRGKQAQTQQQV